MDLKEIKRLQYRADLFWEDYWLVTEPNKHRVITTGDLQEVLRLAEKGLENIQLTAFDE